MKTIIYFRRCRPTDVILSSSYLYFSHQSEKKIVGTCGGLTNHPYVGKSICDTPLVPLRQEQQIFVCILSKPPLLVTCGFIVNHGFHGWLQLLPRWAWVLLICFIIFWRIFFNGMFLVLGFVMLLTLFRNASFWTFQHVPAIFSNSQADEAYRGTNGCGHEAALWCIIVSICELIKEFEYSLFVSSIYLLWLKLYVRK